MQQVPLLHRLLAALMHFLSLLLTFFLPLIVYFAVRKKSDYFSFHAKEGLNLHFTFFSGIFASFWFIQAMESCFNHFACINTA